VALPGGLRFECIAMSKTLVGDAFCTASHRSDAANDAIAIDEWCSRPRRRRPCGIV
jgi:hypothetical protein